MQLPVCSRWPVQELRTLVQKLRDVNVCDKCTKVTVAALANMLLKKENELDVEFPTHAKTLFNYVFCPFNTKEDDCCADDKKRYQDKCVEFLNTNPKSTLSPLLSFPIDEVYGEEGGMIKATSRVWAYMYLNSTRLLLSVSLLPKKADEGDLIRLHKTGLHSPTLFKDIVSIANSQESAKFMQMQEIALLRHHFILNHFRELQKEREELSKMGVSFWGGAAASVAVVFSVASFGLFTMVAAALGAGFAGYKTIMFMKRDFPRTPYAHLKFLELSPSIFYAFDTSSSGANGRIAGTVVNYPSNTVGFIRIDLNAVYHFYPFNLNESEPLSADVLLALSEDLKAGLDNHTITISNLREIIHTLQTALLKEHAPKLLNLKTEVYLQSLFINHLILSAIPSEDHNQERLFARKFVEADIRSHLLVGWPATEQNLKEIVEQFKP